MNFDYYWTERVNTDKLWALEKETNQLNSTAILAQNLVNSKKNFETPWHSGVLTIPPFAEIAPFLFHVFLSPTLFLVHLPKVDRGNIWRHLTDSPIIQFIDFQLNKLIYNCPKSAVWNRKDNGKCPMDKGRFYNFRLILFFTLLLFFKQWITAVNSASFRISRIL